MAARRRAAEAIMVYRTCRASIQGTRGPPDTSDAHGPKRATMDYRDLGTRDAINSRPWIKREAGGWHAYCHGSRDIQSHTHQEPYR